MAEKIINNPSLLPSDLSFELSGNTITAISGHPIAGSGGGTQSDYVYYPDFDETTGNIEFKLGTIYNPPSPIGGWHISGADGARGPQGDPGDDGKTPTFQINSENAHWEWKYTDDVAWTDTHVVASGAVGPQGDPGDDGISPTVSTSVIDGGNRVTFTYGAGSSTYIDVMSGTPGVKGDDGISPTVSTETIAGGNRVTFTYDTPSKTKYIDVMSGAPGTPGADGISPTISTTPITDDPDHPQGGTKVTVTDSTGSEEFKIWNGVNGQGATVNLKDGDGIHITQSSNDYTIGVSANYSAMAVSWVQDQHYLTTVPDSYATKTYANNASANAYNEAIALIPDVTDFITKDVADLTYYYNKSETSSTSEITNALSTKLDSTVAEQTYQTKADMTDYLTTSDASTTYQPKGNYVTTSDLTDYATKTYANEASANALSQAESWVETEGYIKSVPDITANNGLSANGHTVGISNTGIDANKQYAWTTTGWQLVSVPTIPDITANNGLSANGHTVGIDDTNIAANKQYAWTTTGWDEVDIPSTSGYLPLSGGTVSGQLVVSGGSNFDNQNLQFIREGVQANGRVGIGSNGALVLKHNNGAGQSTQLEFSTEYENGEYKNGSLILKAGNTEKSRVINVTTSGYTNMNTFDPTNGPNYMLRKLPDGSFDIGAKVVNVTTLPGTTEANTYYFIYDVT